MRKLMLFVVMVMLPVQSIGSEAEWPSFMTSSGLTVPDSVLTAVRYAMLNGDVEAYGSLLDEECIFRDFTIQDSCGKEEDLERVAVVFKTITIRTFETNRVDQWTEYGSNMQPPVGARVSDEHPNENWEVLSHSTTCYMSREGDPSVLAMPMNSELKLRKDADTGVWRIVRWTEGIPEPRTQTLELEEGSSENDVEAVHSTEEVQLPQPETEGIVSVEEALSKRRSIREYSDQALSLQEVGQILWAAQGITSPRGFRTAPSAGGKYPIALYLVASNVDGLAPGVYRYDPEAHILRSLMRGDWRRHFYNVAGERLPVLRGAVNLVITATYERTKAKYADSWEQYVHIEVGCVVQNVYLQAEAMGLGTVVIGAFDPDKVKELLGTDLAPLAIMPIGKR